MTDILILLAMVAVLIGASIADTKVPRYDEARPRHWTKEQ